MFYSDGSWTQPPKPLLQTNTQPPLSILPPAHYSRLIPLQDTVKSSLSALNACALAKTASTHSSPSAVRSVAETDVFWSRFYPLCFRVDL